MAAAGFLNNLFLPVTALALTLALTLALALVLTHVVPRAE